MVQVKFSFHTDRVDESLITDIELCMKNINAYIVIFTICCKLETAIIDTLKL